MAAPKRRAAWGTEQSVREDLLLARDAGGLAQAGADRLEGSLRLRFETSEPTSEQLQQVRAWLAEHIERAVSAFQVTHAGDRTQLAAADSARSILLQDPENRTSAKAIRQAAVDRHQCFVAADSLRKRELPVLDLIATSVYADTTDEDAGELFINTDSMLRTLAPFAELAALNVEDAALKFAQRAALHDEAVLVRAVQHAIWAVAKFGVLPVYGLERLRALGVNNFADQSIEQLLEAIVTAPFTVKLDDLYQLATATRLDEDAESFYNRLAATPVMQPVVQRFVLWLAGHDGRTCHFFDNDVMVGYCSPHYYVSLCESLAYVQEDWASGDFQREANELAASLGLAQHRRDSAL